MDPASANPAVLTVLLFSSIAAAMAYFGALPFRLRRPVPLTRIGAAYALASGLMLGAGYVLLAEGLGRATLPVILGAGLGVAYTYWTHAITGTRELKTTPGEEHSPDYGVKFILLNALHSASEGVAIGVAMVVDLRLGVFMALALATHNVAEAAVLTDVLRKRGTPFREAELMCIVTKVPQILLAVVAFAVTPAIPDFLNWALGFAAGSLVYLVMTELLPASYERAGRTGIAFMVSFTAGGVVFLKGLIL